MNRTSRLALGLKAAVFLFLPLQFSVTAFSAAELTLGLSAARPLSVPSATYISEALKNSRHTSLLATSSESALDRKVSIDGADWDRVPTLTEAQLEKSFESVRDTKFFTDEDGRPRRATWLYPDDGCFVRAAAAAEHIESVLKISSAKIFAFGDLEVKTENSPQGSVGWWYHVAAIGKVIDPKTGDSRIFVYDPAIQPKKAMEVSEWLKAMNAPKAEIAVCSGGAYDPTSECDKIVTSPSRQAQREVQWFLPSEWWRLEELGREPEKELGDSPPWQAPFLPIQNAVR